MDDPNVPSLLAAPYLELIKIQEVRSGTELRLSGGICLNELNMSKIGWNCKHPYFRRVKRELPAEQIQIFSLPPNETMV